MYSDQPTIPSSVVILRNELTRQPASQCRSSTLTIFIGTLLDDAVQVIRRIPIVPDCLDLAAGKAADLPPIDAPPLAVRASTGGAVHLCRCPPARLLRRFI